jgi:DNA polymerase III sliding clamp (beta) subunit (PCNA family)
MWGSLGESEKYMPKALETSTPMPFPISFNAQYLLDAMNQFSASEYVAFEFMKGPLRPVKVTGLNSEALVVIMPMMPAN